MKFRIRASYGTQDDEVTADVETRLRLDCDAPALFDALDELESEWDDDLDMGAEQVGDQWIQELSVPTPYDSKRQAGAAVKKLSRLVFKHFGGEA